jgi:glycosyltransferase involved in cell wall biosynthesis
MISCILTLHNEGLLAHKTLLAIERASQYARQKGFPVELIPVFDRPNEQTRSLLERRWQGLKPIVTDYGDPGLARNTGIHHSHGDYIAIMDGDDLISKNWFKDACALNMVNQDWVMHPEKNVCFGRSSIIFSHPDQASGDFDMTSLSTDSYWTSLCFAARKIFEKCPYMPTPKQSAYGYEDWHWNCEIMYQGYSHRVVPQTAHFIRLKAVGSRNTESAIQKKIMRHSRLFGAEMYLKTQPYSEGL